MLRLRPAQRVLAPLALAALLLGAGPAPEPGPTCNDAMDLAALDRVAVDRASLDRVYELLDPKLKELLATPYAEETARAVAETIADNDGDPISGCNCAAARLGLRYDARRVVESVKHAGRVYFAQWFLRPSIDAFRYVMTHMGEISRKYVTGKEMDQHAFRWSVVEHLYKNGKFDASFGHPRYDGMVKVLSPVLMDEAAIARIKKQERLVGRPLQLLGETIPIKPLRLSPMVSISGMSFPQLSANAITALTYIHLKLAQQGVYHAFNTGEGGPNFHLALLSGDREKLTQEVVRWAKESGQWDEGSADHAQLMVRLERLFALRDELFQEFSPADMAKAQIVAQFGSALNGIRGENDRIDFEKLKAVGENPAVAMVQFKLKQAAKRGSLVDGRKIDDITAAVRHIKRGEMFKSPQVSPEWSSYEDIALLVKSTKAVTGKPVSLKFGIGQVQDAHAMLARLKELDALPDHIQVDGAGPGFSPGSGAAPVGGDTSIDARLATIVADALLKKLGIRDQVYLEVSGDVMLPAEAVEMQAIGADGVAAARLWMGMGLACSQVRACKNGQCPYGIAARSNSIFALGLNPKKIGPQGATAALEWAKGYTQTLGEAGVTDWRAAATEQGLGNAESNVRKAQGGFDVPLREFYSFKRVRAELKAVMTDDEIRRFVYGGTAPE
jgi:glutamate synthase domain-containing protein 2